MATSVRVDGSGVGKTAPPQAGRQFEAGPGPPADGLEGQEADGPLQQRDSQGGGHRHPVGSEQGSEARLDYTEAPRGHRQADGDLG